MKDTCSASYLFILYDATCRVPRRVESSKLADRVDQTIKAQLFVETDGSNVVPRWGNSETIQSAV